MSPVPRGPALPLAAAAAAAALFIGMDLVIKGLGGRFDAVQMTFLRFASGSVFAVLLWSRFRTPWPARGSWKLHALRGGLLLMTLMTWFHALKMLPLVQAVAVGYTAPLFISLLAVALLKERPSPWVGASLALGVLGVGVALWPEWRLNDSPASAARIEGLAAAALSALFYSGVVILARHQAQRDALWTILVVQNVLPALLLAAPAALHWQPMAASDLGPVLLTGFFATGGLLAITWAFQHLEASRAAPVEYTGLIWAAAGGYLFFGEVPTAWNLTSAALIVGGCLLLLRK